MKNKIIIGTRGSKLALIQSESVAMKLKGINPHLEILIEKIVTRGDRDRLSQLDQIAGDGIFVKELEDALLDGKIDIAVHSLKDMLTVIPPSLCLAAVTERIDPRDVLIARSKRLAELTPRSKIGTGSIRRAVQLSNLRPDLEVCNIRGNIETRLRKVLNGDMDGIIVAAAAMLRLELVHEISEYLPLEHFLPAVGQGALGIETRLGDIEINEILSCINHKPTWQSINAERTFLKALGGGCRAPIAAIGTVKDTTLELKGMVANISGENILMASEEGNTSSPEQVGMQLAEKMLAMGASVFITEGKEV